MSVAVKIEEKPDILKVLKIPLQETYGDKLSIPSGLKLSEEDAFRVIENYFGRLDYNLITIISTCCVYITKMTRVVLHNSICHMSFQDRKNEGNLGAASMFIETLENKELITAALKWFMSDQFPWKQIISYTTLLYNAQSGLLTGVYVNEEGMTKFPHKFIKNFFIFLRMFSEKPDQMNVWYRCVKEGLHPSEAFYLASMFKSSTNDCTLSIDLNTSIRGWHWPLSENDACLNWKNYLNGTPDFNFIGSEKTNCIWQKTGGDKITLREDFTNCTINSKTFPYRDYKKDGIQLSELLTAWTEHKKKHEIGV